MACARQVGKSVTAAALAVKTAILEPPSSILIVAPTQRQSGEIFRDKIVKFYHRLGSPCGILRETATELALGNGSRIIALPQNEEGIVGYSSVDLLIIDEAKVVSDAVYYSMRPVLAASRGRLVLLSSPYGKRGFFFDEWEKGVNFRRWKVRADECPHYSSDFLAAERVSMGKRWYEQEYEVSFVDTIDAVFDAESLKAAMRPDVSPLWEESPA